MAAPGSSQPGREQRSREQWFEFNYGLEAEGRLSRLNRSFVANSWRSLFRLDAPSGEVFWLATARVFELALVCAGNYADCCELSAADEMIKGSGRSEVRDRAAEHGVGGITLKRCILYPEAPGGDHGPETAMGPALPPLTSLSEALAGSGRFCRAYLDLARKRCLAVRRTVGYFRSQGLIDHKSYCQALAGMEPELRAQVRSQGCRFNLECFHRMGFELHQLLQNHKIKSRFLLLDGTKPIEDKIPLSLLSPRS